MKKKQMIISLSREYGSGGHLIAEQLAKDFGLSLFDHNMLDEIAREKRVSVEKITKYDERPRISMYRTVRGFSNSPEGNIAQMQFDYLRKKADAGESFVIVGRCSETVLKGYPGLLTFFILADEEQKIKRVMEVRNVSAAEAKSIMRRHDKKRKAYHNTYCDMRWGDSRIYDMTINSSRLGVEGTVSVLENYIEKRREFIR